jgi:WD40 repeat protein
VLRVWDATDGRPLLSLNGEENTPGLALVGFGPDGRRIAAVDESGTALVWDAGSGRLLHKRTPKPGGAYCGLAFTPDGKRLILADRAGTVRISDANSDEEILTFDSGTSLTGMALSPDGKTLAVGDDGAFDTRGEVLLWDPSTGRRLRRFEGLAPMQPLAFSPDGKLLALCEPGNTVVLYDSATCDQVGRFQGDGSCRSASFSPDGLTLAATYGKTVRLWDVRTTGKEIRRLEGHRNAICSVAFSPDGKSVVTGGEDWLVRLWDPATGRERPAPDSHHSPIREIAVAADGKRIAVADWSGEVRLWDATTSRQVRLLSGGRTAVLTADARTTVQAGRDGSLRWLDVESGEERRRTARPDPSVRVLALSADGKILATANALGVQVWDATAAKELFRVRPGPLNEDLAFSPDGRTLAADCDGALVLWDVASQRERLRIEHATTHFSPIVFAPDGRSLAYGHGGELVWLELSTGRPRHVFRADSTQSFQAIAFSPDGRLLAAANSEAVQVWDLPTGVRRQPLIGHERNVQALTFFPDGRTLVSGSLDGAVLLWDVPPDRPLRPRDEAELRSLLPNLGDADGTRFYAALRGLLATPDQAVPLLRKLVRAAPAGPEPARVARLIAELDDDSFEVRNRAHEELARHAVLVETDLCRALARDPSPEARRHLQDLLALATTLTPQALTELRVIETLERIGTSEARRTLEEVASGNPSAPLTREAKAGLERLRRLAP